MTPVGGRRDRLIHHSLFELVQTILTDLGWFNSGRAHLPLNLIDEPVPTATEVPLNTISVFLLDINADGTEIGSVATDDTHVAIIHIFAQSEALGVDVCGDIRAGLQGKYPSIGRTNPVLPVYDYAQATPPLLFYCQIENVRRDRATDWPQPWRQFWYELEFDLVDEAVA